jgi:ABC-type bacteriocin/lantibiotic exporter with double-glycine peptidase domain
VFNVVFPTVASLLLFAAVAPRDGATGQPLSTAAFLAFYAAFTQFLLAGLQMSSALIHVLQVVPLYERAKPILETAPEVAADRAAPGKLEGHIELSHVSFRYRPDGPFVLDDVSLSARAGEFVAVVGPSGAGKSTVMRLILGFEVPESGSVCVDGKSLASLDVQAVRRQMGVVLQHGQVLPGSLCENIVGATTLKVDDAWAAARLAGLATDIEAMPMGMHTYVPEGGSTLSGGQRQRLLIARAVVGRPRILLFDEATSALDNLTQSQVAASLEALRATRIVIAHRLSTIERADRIYLVQGGRVVQSGTYGELIRQPGPFADLARRQLV